MTLTDTNTTTTDPDSTTASGFSSGPRPRARHDLDGQPSERLEAEVIDLSARLAAGTYELLVLVGELDHRGSWATWGALSCAAWLAAVDPGSGHHCAVAAAAAARASAVVRDRGVKVRGTHDGTSPIRAGTGCGRW